MIVFSFFQWHEPNAQYQSLPNLFVDLSEDRTKVNHHLQQRDRCQNNQDDERCISHLSVLRYIMSSSSTPIAPFFFSSWMLRPSPRISLQSTSKETGVPASSVLVPFTIDS